MGYDDWMGLGAKLTEAVGSAMWMIGDWLAYGHSHYAESHWGNRAPDGLYEKLSKETGYAYQTLKNAKYVCQALPMSRRRDNLTYTHATEIVAHAAEDKHEYWIEKATKDGLSVKALREQLRKARSTTSSEPHDHGRTSILEQARQFTRDFAHWQDEHDMSPALRLELGKILAPVVRDLAG